MNGCVLVVEDEPKLARVLHEYLTQAGYRTEIVRDGREVSAKVKACTPDLVLLDLMLPGRDGIEICREIRTHSQVPIVIVTARVEEGDRLLGLEVGADDYICKPFSPREVVARVRTVLRRAQPSVRANPDTTTLNIDSERHLARWRDTPLSLTPVEFRLLRVLAEHPGRVWSRAQLLHRLYEDHRVVTDRTVDSHVKNLRRKLVEAGAADEIVRAVYGIGYKLELP